MLSPVVVPPSFPIMVSVLQHSSMKVFPIYVSNVDLSTTLSMGALALLMRFQLQKGGSSLWCVFMHAQGNIELLLSSLDHLLRLVCLIHQPMMLLLVPQVCKWLCLTLLHSVVLLHLCHILPPSVWFPLPLSSDVLIGRQCNSSL